MLALHMWVCSHTCHTGSFRWAPHDALANKTAEFVAPPLSGRYPSSTCAGMWRIRVVLKLRGFCVVQTCCIAQTATRTRALYPVASSTVFDGSVTRHD